MVPESIVLFRVQHFQHRGCGIPAEIPAHLVDLVKKEYGIDSTGLFDT